MPKKTIVSLMALGLLVVFLISYAHFNRTSMLAYIFKMEPSYRDIEKGIVLYGDIMSYDGPSRVLEYLENREATCSHAEPVEFYKMVMTTIDCDSNIGMEFDGKMRFHFMNERLELIVLYPADPCRPYTVKNKQTRRDKKYLRVRRGTNKGVSYISISDKRLEEEHATWIAYHS